MFGLNILFSRAVQKEVHLEHIVEKILSSLFSFGKRFYLEKECFSQF